MKKLFSVFFSFILLVSLSVSFAEMDLSEYPLIFSNEFADIYFDKIDIGSEAMYVYCICENKTDKDLSFRMKRFLVNNWDVIESSTFDGFFRVSANSKKRDRFEFSKAVSSSGITDPATIKTIDFSLELKSWEKSDVIYRDTDYVHFDIPSEVLPDDAV